MNGTRTQLKNVGAGSDQWYYTDPDVYVCVHFSIRPVITYS